MNKNLELKQIEQLLIDNRDEIFKDDHAEAEFVSFFYSVADKNVDEIINLSRSKTLRNRLENYGLDEYAPIGDYLIKIAGEKVMEYEDILDVVNSKRQIWSCKPDRVAKFFKELGISYSELLKRIRNQCIECTLDFANVMARSSEGTEANDFKDATYKFALRKEEHKREKFLEQLKTYF